MAEAMPAYRRVVVPGIGRSMNLELPPPGSVDLRRKWNRRKAKERCHA